MDKGIEWLDNCIFSIIEDENGNGKRFKDMTKEELKKVILWYMGNEEEQNKSIERWKWLCSK